MQPPAAILVMLHWLGLRGLFLSPFSFRLPVLGLTWSGEMAFLSLFAVILYIQMAFILNSPIFLGGWD